MSRLQRKALSQPDEDRSFGKIRLLMFDLGGHEVSWSSARPGWSWRVDIKPIAGTEWCEFYHVGFSLSGRLRVQHRDGAELEVGPDQFFEIPPFHDAWVVGDEPWVSLDWGENVAFARAAGTAADRFVATLLFTDIVESTAAARRLGDARWRDLLGRHNRLVREHLQRFRGREVDTTGDGFLAVFDSAEAAVHCALAICLGVVELGLEVRCGVHTGEVEMAESNVRGLAVHLAARVVALAGPGEVLVSWTTRELLSGSRFEFSDRGLHELKGLPDPKRVYAVVPP